MLLWLKDPRYSGGHGERDEAFIDHVVACVDLTDTETVGAGVGNNLVDAMGSGEPADFQDPQNTLGQFSDVYRDYSEAKKDIASALYKSSAFERERVARKLDRSVPDSAVQPESQMAGSFQVTGDLEADWGGEK